MKEQIKIILKRLLKPSVLLAIASEIITILMLLKVNVDKDTVMGIITAAGSLFVILGIVSNPDTSRNDFMDDIYMCSGCGEKTRHIKVGQKTVCEKCGCENCKMVDSDGENER